MSIPEKIIMDTLDTLLGSSDAGDTMHHLYVVSAPIGAAGPLGLVPEDQLEMSVYAIATDESLGHDGGVEDFINSVVLAAAVEQAGKGRAVLFAAMSQEVWGVDPMDDLAQRLRAQGRLAEHPNVAELTIMYGVCRDGRRWRGRRWLTGEQAGQTALVDLLVGPPRRGESRGVPSERLMRRMVGLPG